jgi:hypothetical protein
MYVRAELRNGRALHHHLLRLLFRELSAASAAVVSVHVQVNLSATTLAVVALACQRKHKQRVATSKNTSISAIQGTQQLASLHAMVTEALTFHRVRSAPKLTLLVHERVFPQLAHRHALGIADTPMQDQQGRLVSRVLQCAITQ